jgi:hypothetical protein
MRASSWKQIFDRRSLLQIEQTRLKLARRQARLRPSVQQGFRPALKRCHPIAQPLPIHAGASERFAPSRNLRQQQSARSD